MRLTGSYFELTDRVAASAGQRDAGDGGDWGSELLISVAKRLVKSAVRRNTVKRIVREAWRAATDNGIARQRSQADGQPSSGKRTCLVRLRRSPWVGADPRPSFAMIKRSLRRDADQLFATFRAKRK